MAIKYGKKCKKLPESKWKLKTRFFSQTEKDKCRMIPFINGV